MSETLRRIQTLVFAGDFHVSDHGFDELRKDGILIEDAVSGMAAAILIEDYPERQRGPGILSLQYDAGGNPIHVVWALPANARRPAVLVTAYRPNPAVWDGDFRRRKAR